ncbi:MAG TPA: chemotaxis protein CheW, partial [Thermoanaerobaculaceae bacterium]|nr:chemotaxis protein CheW [Thermoanaerobaculaceae bacterium]
ELLGLAEFTGEPIPVLDPRRLVNAPAGARPAAPVTVVGWVGQQSSHELVGLAADAALEIVTIAPSEGRAAEAGAVCGEASVAGRKVRILNLESLGAR